MSKFANCLRKGQWIVNSLDKDSVWDLSNDELDKIIEKYDDYLIKNQVCPQCYEDLPPSQDVGGLCHPKCGW